MGSWSPSGSLFAGATVSATPGAVLCGDFPVPNSDTLCSNLAVGGQCNYTCAEGYLPVGNEVTRIAHSDNLVCTEDGSFSGGGCEAMGPPPPPPPEEPPVEEEDGGLEGWQVALIVAGGVTVTLAAAVQQILQKRKRMGSVMDDSKKASGYAVKP